MDSLGQEPFGALLGSFRTRSRKSQQKLAELIGVSRGTIVAWERGDYLPKTRDKVLEIARQLALEDEDAKLLLKAALLDDSLSIWNVPYYQNPFFTGREEIIKHLRNMLAVGKRAALMQAISGLGGIGKTQIAVEYAHRYRDEYHAVIWVRADSLESIALDFVALGSLLHLPERNAEDQNVVIGAVKRWLDTHDRWLLIYDNVDDLKLIFDFLPSRSRGHVLLTTRAQALGTIAQGIIVDHMESEVGTLFLLRRAKLLSLEVALEQSSAANRSAADEVVRALGGLPLALDQAGAYIEESKCGLSRYLELLQMQQTELLKRRGKFTSGHPESVTTTFSLSFEKVQQTNPIAVELLRLCAFLYPEDIPEEILTKGAVKFMPMLQPFEATPLAFDEALGELLKYSLISRDANARTLTIHRLVQAVLKDEMDEIIQKQFAEYTVQAVNRTFRAIDAASPGFQQYLPQALECVTLIEQKHLALSEAADLMESVGNYLGHRGQFMKAESLHQQALAISEQTFGPENPLMATSLNNLATLYAAQGKYRQAKSSYQRALAIWQSVKGPRTPHEIRILTNLAGLYIGEGKLEQAEALYKQALTMAEQALQPEDEEIAHTLNGLAVLYSSQGKFERALSLYQRALAINEKTLGPEHPATAVSLNDLADLYQGQGKYEQAEQLFLRALAIREQMLEPEHPDIAASLTNLAELYVQEGKYEQAEPLFLRALEIYEQVQGPELLGLADTLNHLAELYEMQAKYKQAEPLFLRALAIHEQAQGPEHPDLAASLNHVAALYKRQGKYEQAELLYSRALAICIRVLGPEHPNTAGCLSNLADLYAIQGEYHQAEPLLLRALQIYEQALGAEHPRVAKILNPLAFFYEKQGKYEQAEPLYRRALTIRERTLGPEHLDTAQTLNQLAFLCVLQGKYEQAEPLFLRALAIRERTLGSAHPDLANSLINLAFLYEEQGNYQESDLFYQRAIPILAEVLGSEDPSTIAVLQRYILLLGKMEQSGS